MSIIIGIFFILHAFVHLLYAGQALRFFELRPGLAWPAGAWAFSRLLGDPATRWLAAVSLVLAALGFLSAALGLFFGAGWARTVTLGAAGLSILIYLLFWDGEFREAAQKAGNVQAVAELASVDPAYTSPDWQNQLATQRKWLLHFGGVYHTSNCQKGK
jgi:hypothetical protein